MRLSPDGRWVALGDHDTSEALLELVDLGTGDVVGPLSALGTERSAGRWGVG
jgi:hypothetical protein